MMKNWSLDDWADFIGSLIIVIAFIVAAYSFWTMIL